MKTLRSEKGFTLIELVMVIVILGILAAFALPRYANLVDDACDASARGALGTLRSSNAILYADRLTAGTTGTYTMANIVGAADIQGMTTASDATNFTVTAGSGCAARTFTLAPTVLQAPTTVGTFAGPSGW